MIKEREENCSNRKLWDELYNGFNTSICEDCFKQKPNGKTISFPQPIPYIGPKFSSDEYRLTFVGIETWGNDIRKPSDANRYDPFDEEDSVENVRKAFFEWKPPFWVWVRRISQEIVAKDKTLPSMELAYAFERIAWTNLLKCEYRTGNALNNSRFEFDEKLAVNCIQKARWIYKEIDRIEAKNVIVFSGRRNNYALARVFLRLSENEPLSKFDYTKYDLPSEKIIKWTDRDLFIRLSHSNKTIIVTNHPQGTPNRIRDEIIKIIRNNKKGCP